MDTKEIYQKALEDLQKIEEETKKRAAFIMKRGGLLDALFVTELDYLLEHESTEEEVRDAVKYLCDIEDDFTGFADVADALQKWKVDNCVQCEYCGLWWLPDEMQKEDAGYFCDEKCKCDYCEEHGKTNYESYFEHWKE